MTQYDHEGAHACAMSELLWNNTVTPETRQYLTANHNAAMAEIAELRQALQALTWKARDQLYALKDSKCDYVESAEYIEQLKEYIANAERVLNVQS